MARRHNNSTIEDFIVIASRLPWWLCLLLAVISWFGLHAIAIREIAPPRQPINLSAVMIEQMIHGGAMAGQYILPLLLVAGAFLSILNSWRRRELFGSVNNAGTATKSVQGLSWQQFEQLTGETFRRRGFKVTENATGGADGGIDLVLHKGREKYLVQCKQWRAFKVGVSVVRELYGVMAAGGAAGGFVVTSGRFTKEASEFAKGRNVELIDGVELQRWIQVGATAPVGSVNAAVHEQRAPTLQRESAVCCPKCQATMVRRTAKRGTNAGNSFWGCSRYPDCRGTQQLV